MRYTVNLSALNVKYAAAVKQCAPFVKYTNFLAPFYTTVIVVCSKFFKVRSEFILLNPPIEINGKRFVFINHFTSGHKPFLYIFFGREYFFIGFVNVSAFWHKRRTI